MTWPYTLRSPWLRRGCSFSPFYCSRSTGWLPPYVLSAPISFLLLSLDASADKKEGFTVAEAIELCKEAFVTAGERDMYTGDAVEIFAITAAGVTRELFELKKD